MIAVQQRKMNRSDIQIIHTHYNLGKYFGLTTAYDKRISNWYVSALLLCLFVYAVHRITEKVIEYRNTDLRGIYLVKIFDVINFITNLIYIGVNFLGCQFGRRKWKALFTNLDSLEKMLPEDFIVNKSVRRFKVNTAIYHLIFLILNLSEYVYYFSQNRTTRLSLIGRIVVYCRVFDTILIVLSNQMLRRRYKHLTEMIRSSIKSTVNINVILKQEEEKRIIHNLGKVLSTHQILHECVEKLNGIFGWKLFLNLQGAVISFLTTFNFIVIKIKDKSDINLQDNVVIYMIYVSLISMVSVKLTFLLQILSVLCMRWY